MDDWLDMLTVTDLPPQIKTLADIIGVASALAICKSYPGITIYIPTSRQGSKVLGDALPCDRHKDFRMIALLIGDQSALALSEVYQGAFVYVPKLDDVLRSRRDRLIRDDKELGMDYKDIARKYSKSERWIREIIDHREDTRQLSLF